MNLSYIKICLIIPGVEIQRANEPCHGHPERQESEEGFKIEWKDDCRALDDFAEAMELTAPLHSLPKAIRQLG
jgi:hypothetical protein